MSSAARPAALLAAWVTLLAAPVAAVVPSAQKLADTVAESNRAAGRADPLLFEVQLRIGDSGPLATGLLATHPTGLARLELRSTRGFVERHLLQGSEYRASRDGELIGSPRPFLPPVFLLQATSGAALQAALASFGVAAGEVVLGMADEHDCYVFGGRLPGDNDEAERRLPSLWIDVETFEVVQIDRAVGVRIRFGPSGVFDDIRAPSWIEIEAPDKPRARLEVMGVSTANAAAAAFGSDWLVPPEEP